MKTDVECLPCFVRQSLQVARIAGCSERIQLRVVQKISAIVANLDVGLSPPDNAGNIYQTIAGITGCSDPYRHLKAKSNEQALRIVSSLHAELEAGGSQLRDILRFIIAGNCLDYGAFASVDLECVLKRCRTAPLAVDHTTCLEDRIRSLVKGDTVLYLADNCGEIVFDRLLIEYLRRRGLEVTVAVKEGPIINDALVEDAIAAGLDQLCTIVSNGSCCPGTVLSSCSEQFRRLFSSADLVISKGQGNFESLSEVEREVFFLLMLKCQVAARHMAHLTGVDPASFPGGGEMAVYCSTMHLSR